ncbi:unnamed protein product [Victoria cruziana]
MSLSLRYEENGKCCRLKKALYGLKQSPRAWFGRLRGVMKKAQGNGEHTLFVRKVEGKTAILLVYVNDMITTGDDEAKIKRMKEFFASEFEIKDLGRLRYFVGIEVAYSKNGLTLNQRKYTLDLFKDTIKLGCKPVATHIEANHQMNIKDGESLEDKEKGTYQRLVGKLIYLTLTRSDITYAVNVVSQFMHAPSNTHMIAVQRILCYLKKNSGRGLLYTKQETLDIETYMDADWAGSVDYRRSTTGYCIYMGENLMIWRSKRMGVTELLWIKILLQDIGIRLEEPMRLYCDNKVAINLSNNHVLYDRTKHIELDRHFIREKIDSRELTLPFVKTQDQNIFIKGLSSRDFGKNVCKLGIFDMYAQLEGEC